jgi:hypothetical protein
MMKVLSIEIMLNRILIFLLAFIGCSCNSNVDKSLIDNWSSYAIPTNPDTLRNYNNSQVEWTLFIKDNKVHVVRSRPYHDPSVVPFKINSDEKEKLSALQVTGGYLVGFYRGEWGGHLNWFSNDGKDSYLISNDEIVQFIKTDKGNYAIQGLNHMGFSNGSIINIENDGKKWVDKEYLKLPLAPYAIASDSYKNFFIITSNNLLKVDSNRKITTLIRKGIWNNGIYSNSISMIIKNNIVYAGMRVGVYKYNLSTGKEEWLLPY